MPYTLSQKRELIDKILNPDEFERIFKDLTLSAIRRFNNWKLQHEKGIKGYSPSDIASMAIEKVYLGEWNWDPDRSPLIPYLKTQVIKGLVANLAEKPEVKSASIMEISDIHVESEKPNAHMELYATEVIEMAKERVKDDHWALKVLEARYELFDRGDTIDYHEDLTPQEYDNAVKRLDTQMRRIAKELDIKSSKEKS